MPAPRIVTKASATLEFRTKSDNYRAYLKGPGLPADGRRIKHKGKLAIDKVGLYSVAVRDRQFRSITASITDKLIPPVSVPPQIEATESEFVVLEVEVR